MSQSETPKTRVGIIGGGQLAQMLCRAAPALNIATCVLDPDPDAPAASAADTMIRGELTDPVALAALAAAADVITIEIENVDVEALARIVESGTDVYPRPPALRRLVNKLHQKTWLRGAGLPTSDFTAMEAPDPDAVRAFGLPCVQKLQRSGYDGRGVAVLHSTADLSRLLPGPSLLERFVNCRVELAVVVARSTSGEVCSYTPTELVFDSARHVLDALIAPARIPAAIAEQAQQLAERTIERLDGAGVHAVELFLDENDELLINEISPRVHNSGHHTIEANATSQFEQHLRIVAGLPLGPIAPQQPAAMVNLLGEEGSVGRTVATGLQKAAAVPGVSVHLYGKRECRPGRKMGHIAAVAADADAALANARRARSLIRIYGATANDR